MDRWAWLDLDSHLVDKSVTEKVLYRHFIPMYLHYFERYMKAKRGNDPQQALSAEKVFHTIPLAFIDELQANQMQLDHPLLRHYDIDLEDELMAGEQGDNLRAQESYETARGIFNDCIIGLDPQHQLHAAELTWLQVLQHKASQLSHQWFH